MASTAAEATASAAHVRLRMRNRRGLRPGDLAPSPRILGMLIVPSWGNVPIRGECPWRREPLGTGVVGSPPDAGPAGAAARFASPAGDRTALESETPPMSRALGCITRSLAAEPSACTSNTSDSGGPRGLGVIQDARASVIRTHRVPTAVRARRMPERQCCTACVSLGLSPGITCGRVFA